MESHLRFQSRAGLILILFICFVCVSGCGALIGMGSNSLPNVVTGDNAFRIRFQRVPHEALSDFQGYLESINIEVLSVNGDTLRSDPGDLHGGLAQGFGQEIRLIAVAEATDDGSTLTVRADYLDPATGEWKEANSKGNVLASYEAQQTRPHYRAYMDVSGLLIRRYGSKNVKFVSTDLHY